MVVIFRATETADEGLSSPQNKRRKTVCGI
jgi:hypothetical protein